MLAAYLLAVLTAQGSGSIPDPFEIFLPATFLVAGEGYGVVGYSIGGLSPLEDAERRWSGQRGVRVTGIRRIHELDGAWMEDRDSVFLLPLVSQAFPNNILIDTGWIEGEPVIFAGGEPIDKTPVAASATPKPAWVSAVPKGKFGVGTSRFSRGAPGASWAVADENALVALARRASVELSQRIVVEVEEGGPSLWAENAPLRERTEQTSREKMDVELRGVRIVARWLDSESLSCFSLARADAVMDYVGKRK